jgi:hypothetical protein
MDRIVADTELNKKWWNSGYCPKIHLLEYELISRPRGVSLDRCIKTKCHITAEALWFCLTGKVLPDGLVYQDEPTSDTLYINCDSDEHAFIVNKDKIYDSFWNKYSLFVQAVPIEMIDAIRQYKPFILPRPDGIVYTVVEYECYSADIMGDSGIHSNYEILSNQMVKN